MHKLKWSKSSLLLVAVGSLVMTAHLVHDVFLEADVFKEHVFRVGFAIFSIGLTLDVFRADSADFPYSMGTALKIVAFGFLLSIFASTIGAINISNDLWSELVSDLGSIIMVIGILVGFFNILKNDKEGEY